MDQWKEFRDALNQNTSPDFLLLEEKFTLSNRTVPDFIDIAILEETNLLGNRWLTRDGSLFVVAPSGHGKSSFCVQCMINWAIGRPAFALKPPRPLRILMVQSEDDDADMKSFVQCTRTMNLSQDEMDLLHENTRVEFRRDLAGERFFCAIDQFLTQYSADILIVNPLTGFCTVDLKDEIGMNTWLRDRLNKIMEKHGCAPMIVAHMPKGQLNQIKDKEWYEWMYVQSGCVTLTNWARAILVFVPSSELRGTYKFMAAKRPTQSGWTAPEYFFSHSKKHVELNGEDFEVIEWIPSTDSQIAAAFPDSLPKTKHIQYHENDVLEVLASHEDQFDSVAQIQELLKAETGMSHGTFFSIWKPMRDQKKVFKSLTSKKWNISPKIRKKLDTLD
jgi:uncharacterized protein YoaH (UPF0181 family)